MPPTHVKRPFLPIEATRSKSLTAQNQTGIALFFTAKPTYSLGPLRPDFNKVLGWGGRPLIWHTHIFVHTNADMSGSMAHNLSSCTLFANEILLPADLRHPNRCATGINTVQYDSNTLTPVVLDDHHIDGISDMPMIRDHVNQTPSYHKLTQQARDSIDSITNNIMFRVCPVHEMSFNTQHIPHCFAHMTPEIDNPYKAPAHSTSMN